MTDNLSARQKALLGLQSFEAWVAERDVANDWLDYIRQGKLNRTEIASECGFALSVVRQNPAVKAALGALEERLRASGILRAERAISNGVADAATAQAVDRRILTAKAQAELRVKALEEQNAALKAEVRDLREQLSKYRHLDEHLCTSGRLLHT